MNPCRHFGWVPWTGICPS